MKPKETLVKLLVDDFIKMFPKSSQAERMLLFSKLNLMEIADLELLVNQL